MPEENVLPINPEELLVLGKMYAFICGVRANLFDDAVQEFVIGAWQAVMSAGHDNNIRAFQVKAGQWAMLNFIKSEIRHQKNQQRIMEMKFALATNFITPLEETIQKEQTEKIEKFLNSLPELEKSVVVGVVMEGRIHSDVAADNKIQRRMVGRILEKIFKKF